MVSKRFASRLLGTYRKSIKLGGDGQVITTEFAITGENPGPGETNCATLYAGIHSVDSLDSSRIGKTRTYLPVQRVLPCKVPLISPSSFASVPARFNLPCPSLTILTANFGVLLLNHKGGCHKLLYSTSVAKMC